MEKNMQEAQVNFTHEDIDRMRLEIEDLEALSGGVDWCERVKQVETEQKALQDMAKEEHLEHVAENQAAIELILKDIQTLEGLKEKLDEKLQSRDMEIKEIVTTLDLRNEDEISKDVEVQSYFDLPKTDHLIDCMQKEYRLSMYVLLIQ